MVRHWCRWLAAAIGSVAAGVAAPAAAAPASLESAVKASYIFKFAPFVEWPANAFAAGAPFTICLSGQDPFGSLIDEVVRGQKAKGRPILIRRLGSTIAPAGCHILFAGRTSGTSQGASTAGQAMLTISDTNSGVGNTMIQFVVEGRRVRFQIDDGAARASGLAISSKLLGLSVTAGRRQP